MHVLLAIGQKQGKRIKKLATPFWGRIRGSGRSPAYAITIELPKRQWQCPCEHRPPAELGGLGGWSKVGSGSFQGGASSSCHLVTGWVQASNKQQAIATSTPPLRPSLRRPVVCEADPFLSLLGTLLFNLFDYYFNTPPRPPYFGVTPETSSKTNRHRSIETWRLARFKWTLTASDPELPPPACRPLADPPAQLQRAPGTPNTEHHIAHHRPSIASSIPPSPPPSWHAGYHAPSW